MTAVLTLLKQQFVNTQHIFQVVCVDKSINKSVNEMLLKRC